MALGQFLLLLCISGVTSLNMSKFENCTVFNEKPFFRKNNCTVLLYADVGMELPISCCQPSNYCYIEWYKDEKMLNIGKSGGHVVAMDTSHEEIKLKPAQLSDEGVFKCVVVNNVGAVNKTVTVQTNKNKACQDIHFESSRETPSIPSVGNPYHITWPVTIPWNASCMFYNLNTTSYFNDCSTEDQHCCLSCLRNSSNTNQLLATLSFKDLREDDLSYSYQLQVMDFGAADQCPERYHTKYFQLTRNLKSPPEVRYQPVTVLASGIVFVALLCFFAWSQFNVHLLLVMKDYMRRSEVSDGRYYDVYISYTWSDVDRLFVFHLKSHLEKRGYRVYIPEIHNIPGGCTVIQLAEALQQSRRFVMVLSPEYVKAEFTAFEVNLFLEAVNKYKDHIIPIVFKGLSLPGDSAICRHIMKVTQTVMWANIDWPISDQRWSTADSNSSFYESSIVGHCRNSKVSLEKSFNKRGYKELLLKLPPKPRTRSNSTYMLLF